jgi:transposase
MGLLTALFPPGKGGGEDVAYGGKGKGVLIHTLTDGNGMPLANCTTAANGSEREQIFPLLDKVKLKTLQPGRPRKRLKVLAADKGYDSKEKRAALRKRGIRPQLPKRVWKTKKNRGRPIKISAPRFQQERCFAWFQRKYRRLVVRWERQSVYFNSFIDLATIHIWIQRVLLVG